MQISCPGCGEQLPISAELLGKKIRCGGCQVVVDVPEKLDDDPPASTPDQAPVPPQAAQQQAAPVVVHPDDTPAMLVDCACGHRSRVPTASAGSELRCPSCQRLMRIPYPPDRDTTFISGGAFPAAALPSARSNTAATAISQAPIDHPFPVQPNRQPAKTNNLPIIITAAACFLGLLVLIGSVTLIEQVVEEPPKPAAEPAPKVEREPEGMKRVQLQEGYSIAIPVGCKQESRQEIDVGKVVYRFRSTEGYGLTLAIITDESINRFGTPPKRLRDAYEKGIPELELDINVKVQPKNLQVNRMRAVVFRFLEKDVYRGVKFTYYMVALDQGKKLVLKFAGKHGDDEEITWPHHWYDSLLTLRNESYETELDAS